MIWEKISCKKISILEMNFFILKVPISHLTNYIRKKFQKTKKNITFSGDIFKYEYFSYLFSLRFLPVNRANAPIKLAATTAKALFED